MTFSTVVAMGGDLLQRLAKKKGGVVVVLQNTTEMTINTLSGSLSGGKPEKSAPMPNIIPPLSQHEVGFYSPQGQWSFGVQGDSAFKTRMTLLHDAEHANLERLPPEAPWTADLQQNWKADVPQVVITFMVRETTPSPSSKSHSKSASTSSKAEHQGETQAGSGKVRTKKSTRDMSEGKPKKEVEEPASEGSGKKKRVKKHKDTPPASDKSEAEHPAPEDDFAPPPLSAAPATAFGIDAVLGEDSSSDSDEGSSRNSGWARKFVINQRPVEPELPGENRERMDESMRRASSMFTVPGGSTAKTTSASTGAAADDDFFKEMDANRSSSSLQVGDRERKVAPVPASATTAFQTALELLNSGKLTDAKNSMHAALSQLSQIAFQSNASIVQTWCFYAQIINLLSEMERLKNDHLFAQQALLARFVGLLGLRLEDSEHALICMRMAVNRNLEMENFRTAAQLLTSMTSMGGLTESDNENMKKKQTICAQHTYSEAHIPIGAHLDAVSGQFLLNGASYVLCHKTLQLARDPTHLFCPYCDATYSERAVSDNKCTYCDSSLQTQV